MRRTLSTEQLPPSTQQQDSGLPVTPTPVTSAVANPSEPVLANRLRGTADCFCL